MTEEEIYRRAEMDGWDDGEGIEVEYSPWLDRTVGAVCLAVIVGVGVYMLWPR